MREVFDYRLPAGLIAQYPLKEREKARLLIADRRQQACREAIFADLAGFVQAGDVLVLNDARVIPARLYARKQTGGKLEVLLLRKAGDNTWEVLLRGKARSGQRFFIDGILGQVLERTAAGSYLVEIQAGDKELAEHGVMPLPPYIRRKPVPEDHRYYQTVYAKKEGAVAAPTAGLHFTPDLLEGLRKKGVRIVFLTLYLGWASFRLWKEEKPESISVPEESFEIPPETAEAINKAKREGRKIFAVGTSCVRALESSLAEGRVIAWKKSTDLFIRPGFVFQVVDALVTNFHLPGSTHLYLVCAFGGTGLMRQAYEYAVRERFRFYSYGDAMLIL